MAIESTEGGGFVVTGEADTRLYQVIALSAMLKMEVRSPGMKASNHGSPFAMLKQLGIIPKNTKTKAKGLEIVDAYLANVRAERKAKNNGTD